MLCHAELTEDIEHLVCPHCNSKLRILWTTEYAEPLSGLNSVSCYKCRSTIEFDVEISVSYSVRKRKERE